MKPVYKTIIIAVISVCAVMGVLIGAQKALFGVRMTMMAPIPPMGWNGWNHFRCSEKVNESLVKQIADAMVSSGMKAVGYRYINLDDCWQVARDRFGTIVPDIHKFPNGMRSLGEYIHSKGLLFGIYTSAGRTTCEKRPGSFGYEQQDVNTYASWGVDYVKVDWCGIDYLDTETQYKKWRQVIEKTGRPMVLSIAIADIEKIDHNDVWKWGHGIGHMWRTTRDIIDYWPDILRIIDENSQYSKFSGPNGWNDADMLQVGNGNMTIEEYRTHFTMWAMMASPLIAGNDIRNMSSDIRNTLTNKDVIAIDQDPLGIQAKKIAESGTGQEVWIKQLARKNTYAVSVVNRADQDASYTISWQTIGVGSVKVRVVDVWAKQDRGISTLQYEVKLPVHGTVLLVVTAIK